MLLGPYSWLFLFTKCRHKFKISSRGKGKGTSLAQSSPSARRHWKLDLPVRASYSWELSHPSPREVLRAVCLPGRAAPVWSKGWLLRTSLAAVNKGQERGAEKML